MNTRTCAARPILEDCPLEDYAFQLDPYIGCVHDASTATRRTNCGTAVEVTS